MIESVARGVTMSAAHSLDLLIQLRSNFSRCQIAAHIGRSATTVARWEKGKSPCPAVLEPVFRNLLQSPLGNVLQRDRAFRFVDLFAGIGGIRMGFEAHGGKCVFTSEWNKFSKSQAGRNELYVSKKKDSKSSPGIGNFILEVGDNTALASPAVYEKFEPTGSKNQWKVGGLTGEMPTAVSLRNRFGKQRKSKYDDIRMEDFEPNFDTSGLYEGHAEDLFREYGISVKFVDSKITFFETKGGKQAVYETTARTPDELYKMLKQQAGEPIESQDIPDFFRDIPNFGEESNPFAGADFGDIQMPEQSPEDAERTANILREKMKQKKVDNEINDLKKDNDNCPI
jgi:transcriptional regulator with XRE-family HTH domain